jgi:hypothetical protein
LGVSWWRAPRGCWPCGALLPWGRRRWRNRFRLRLFRREAGAKIQAGLSRLRGDSEGRRGFPCPSPCPCPSPSPSPCPSPWRCSCPRWQGRAPACLSNGRDVAACSVVASFASECRPSTSSFDLEGEVTRRGYASKTREAAELVWPWRAPFCLCSHSEGMRHDANAIAEELGSTLPIAQPCASRSPK